MAVRTITHNKIVWHHIDGVDDMAIQLLESEFKFHPLDIKDVLDEAEESKVDIYKNYLFLILHFPILHRGSGRVEAVEVDIFLGKNFLITIQKGKFKPLRDLYYKMQNSQKYRKACLGRDAGYLLYRILEVLYKETRHITNYMSRKLRSLEDEVYSDDISEETAKKIAYLRRKILEMKRIFDPQLEVMQALSQLKTRFMPVDLNAYFDDLDDYVEKVANFLDNQKYALKDLLEVHDSLVTHKTNKVIKILTVFSVALLPLTLLSGIYGMNIPLPFSHRPEVIWTIFFCLLLLIGWVVWWMKKRKLL
jgi:magnesium transporter